MDAAPAEDEQGGVDAIDVVAAPTMAGYEIGADQRLIRRGRVGLVRQLAVEALGFLQVRDVTDAFVPGSLGRRAGGEHVLGHRR